MKHSFLKMVALAFIALGFVACGGGKSPIEVKTFTKDHPFGTMIYEKHYAQIRAMVDSVIIKKIIVNRGNCGEYAVDKTIKFGEVTNIEIGSNFEGYSGSGCSSRDIKEAQVVTDKGTWTFNF
ncbi:hypothetical protein ACWIUD_00590 [Helicobacter sp. 23-1044]